MGTADIVPGISGGTMAFILGIYEELIDSIRHLTRIRSLLFLAPLLLGMASAFLILAAPFDSILRNPEWRVYLYAGFLGLILASVVLLSKEMRRWRWQDVLFLLIGGIAAWLLTDTSLQDTYERVAIEIPGAIGKKVINYQNGWLEVSYDEKQALIRKGLIQGELSSSNYHFSFYAMVCGMAAISAMLLPGISGSYLLNILGLYAPAIAALADLLAAMKQGSVDTDAAWFLGSLGFGIILGAALFSHVISWLLKRYHSFTIALLCGFMLGALPTVWPFYELAWRVNPFRLDKGLDLVPLQPTLPPMSIETSFAVLFLTAGFTLVLGIEFLAKKREAVRGRG